MSAEVGRANGGYYIRIPYHDRFRAKETPGVRWDNNSKLWRVNANEASTLYLLEHFEREEFTEEAWETAQAIYREKRSREIMKFPRDYPFKTQPRPYQWDALDKAYGMREFALFMEMRTGKSFVNISLAGQYCLQGDIDRWLIILFPGAIKSTWKIQIEEHMSPAVEYDILLYSAGDALKVKRMMKNHDRLQILVVGIESLANGIARELVVEFAQSGKCLTTIDESTCIKNPKILTKGRKKTRTAICYDAGDESRYRLILTGTPLTQGIEDLYSQYRFLNWQIIGEKSFFTFKREYCITESVPIGRGKFADKIVGYRNVDKLLRKVMPYTYQISTEEATGIPDEVRETLVVEPSKEQKKMLEELGDPYEMATVYEDEELVVETVLERMTRYQQIVGGNFPYEEGRDDKGRKIWKTRPIAAITPKLEALKGVIETLPDDQKVIIWARFIPEIDRIADHLHDLGRGDYIVFKGGMSDEERESAQRRFMDPAGPRFWVATQQASARGVELATASVHIFYSCSFSYDDRKQAEMRTSSSHQKAKSILYVDIVMNHKIDKQIYDALAHKRNVAESVIEEMKRLRSI